MSYLPPVGYQPQYNFWPQYLTPPEAMLAPARRAGWTLIFLGTLALVLGSLGAILAGSLSDDIYARAIEQARATNPQMSQLQATPAETRIAYVAMGVLAALFGALLAGAGAFVRGGSMAASIIGLILLAIPLLLIIVLVIFSLIANPLGGVMALIVLAIPIALMVMAATFLVASLRSAPKVALARQQLLMMHQHQQMMQYQQQSQGYAAPQMYGYSPPASSTQTPMQQAVSDDPPMPPPAGG